MKFSASTIRRTFHRFPLSILCSLTIFVIAVQGDQKLYSLTGLTSFFATGFFGFGIARLLAESREWGIVKEYGAGLIVTALASLIITTYETPLCSVIVMSILFLGVGLAPFLRKNYDDLSFWWFNQKVCRAFILATLGAIIFSAGLSAGLTSLDYLFGIDVPGKFYVYVLLFAAIVYAPFNTLSWIPEKFHIEPEECNAEPGVPFILNWILAPLAILYFLILYGYGAKILWMWDLPHGGVTSMVTGFGGLGILVYMSGWIMRDTGGPLLRFLYRHFFSLLILPVILLFIAIYVRIDEYGLTHTRYMVVALGLWMGFLAVLYTLRPSTSLRTIFISLALTLLIASFGPWGAVSLSDRNQLDRLERVLERNNMIENGIAVPAKTPPSYKEQAFVFAGLEYFVDQRRAGKVAELIPAVGTGKNIDMEEVMQALNLHYIPRYRRRDNDRKDGEQPYNTILFSTIRSDSDLVRVGGYDYYFPSIHVGSFEEGKEYALTDKPDEHPALAGYKIITRGNAVFFVYGAQERQIVSRDEILNLAEKKETDEKPYVKEFRDEGLHLKLIISSAYFRDYGQGKIVLESLSGSLFFSK